MEEEDIIPGIVGSAYGVGQKGDRKHRVYRVGMSQRTSPFLTPAIKRSPEARIPVSLYYKVDTRSIQYQVHCYLHVIVNRFLIRCVYNVHTVPC